MANFTLHKAALLIEAGRAAEVIAKLKARAMRKPQHIPTRYVLARAYEAAGRSEEADREWAAASECVPANASADVDARSAVSSDDVVGLEFTSAFRAKLEAILASQTATEPKPPEDEGPVHTVDEVDDLQRLIGELQSARIAAIHDVDDDEDFGLNLDNDIDGMVTETLARIYVSQNQHAAAARVYEQLAGMHPDEAERFNTLAGDLLKLADEQ